MNRLRLCLISSVEFLLDLMRRKKRPLGRCEEHRFRPVRLSSYNSNADDCHYFHCESSSSYKTLLRPSKLDDGPSSSSEQPQAHCNNITINFYYTIIVISPPFSHCRLQIAFLLFLAQRIFLSPFSLFYDKYISPNSTLARKWHREP